jgi:thioester reductase-like protein
LQRDVDDPRLAWVSIDLAKPKLGLSDADRAELLQNVNVFIHNAWKVNFSWALDSYRPEYLFSVRELIDLSYDSALQARIVFISSISSVQEWAALYPGIRVPEEIPPAYEVASPLGYGQSKHLSERILAKASAVSGVPVTLLRVGQVAGPTSLGYGKWSADEWIPSLTAISKTLRTVPNDVPEIDWVPADLAAKAIRELALLPQPPVEGTLSAPQLNIFNVVNPQLSDWTRYAVQLQNRLGQDTKLVSLVEWVKTLVAIDLKSVSEEQADAAAKIMPFFEHLAETSARGVALQPKFDTGKAVKASETMQQMGEIDEGLMNLWFDQWGI